MISKISTDPTYDAYYEMPENIHENEEIDSDEFDPGEYVLDLKNTKDSKKVEISNPEERKPGHKPTIPGVYDDLYDYDTSPETSVANPNKSVLKEKYACSKRMKIFTGSVIGICAIGAIAVGVIFSIQGRLTFLTYDSELKNGHNLHVVGHPILISNFFNRL